MNTIVWVLLVYTHGSNWVPALEFTTEQKCIVAAAAIKAKADSVVTFGNMRMPMCVRIEK